MGLLYPKVLKCGGGMQRYYIRVMRCEEDSASLCYIWKWKGTTSQAMWVASRSQRRQQADSSPQWALGQSSHPRKGSQNIGSWLEDKESVRPRECGHGKDSACQIQSTKVDFSIKPMPIYRQFNPIKPMPIHRHLTPINLQTIITLTCNIRDTVS